MKYIKPYKIFESSYSFEEYISSISSELGKYNMTPVGIRELIDNYQNAIRDAIINDIDPYTFIKTIADDMNLSDDGGFPSQQAPPQRQTTVKYL